MRFETINAAREAIKSPDIHAIVRDEVLPLAIDYLVYYEGANQFGPPVLDEHIAVEGEYRVGQPPARARRRHARRRVRTGRDVARRARGPFGDRAALPQRDGGDG